MSLRTLSRLRLWLPPLMFSCAAALSTIPSVAAQSDSIAQDQADRYLTIVRRRPRFGTAFDRMYTWHRQRGSLDSLVAHLQDVADDSVDDATDLMLLGLLDLRRGQFESAATSFREAEALLPDDPGPPWFLGKSQLQQGELAEAVHAFDRSLDFSPPRAELATIFLDRGRALLRSERFDDASQNWARIDQAFPGDAGMASRIVQVLIDEGRLRNAEQRLRDLADATRDPNQLAQFRSELAAVLVRLKQIPQAIEELEDTLAELKPGSAPYLRLRETLDQILTNSATSEMRLAYYRQWCDAHPEDVDAHLRLAAMLAETGDAVSEAEVVLQRMLRVAPGTKAPRVAFVQFLTAQNRIKQAIIEQQQLIKRFPGDIDAREHLGRLWLLRNDLSQSERREKAAAVWRSIQHDSAADPVVLCQVARLFLDVEYPEEGLSCYETAIRIAPGNPVYREQLGAYFHESGETERALAAWQQIAAGDRRSADTLFELAAVLRQFGYVDDAVIAATTAANEYPAFLTRLKCGQFLNNAAQVPQALEQLQLAEGLARDPVETKQLQLETVLALRHGVRLSRQGNDLAQAVEYQRRIRTIRADDQSALDLSRLLVIRAAGLERAGDTATACTLLLEALQLDPASWAGELESHVQSFEHAGLLPSLASGLTTASLDPFRGHATQLLRIAADIQRKDADNVVATQLVRDVFDTFHDDRDRLRIVADTLELIVPQTKKELDDGTD
jgi:tetratricopeptide (TPR) repeat protein